MTQAIDEQALLSRLRGGQDEAFSELFEAHAPAVRRLARGLASDASEAEDITAETFFRVLRAIKRGNGPNDNVRGYLLTVARRVAWEWKGAAHDVPVTDDELTSRAGATEPAAANAAECSLIARAFTSLPERWRTVLWRTEVEGAQPAVVAPHFGLSPNATAALARRARQGLRAAYLQAHLGTHTGSNGCRSVLDKLGSYTAGAVTAAEASRISAHLGGCAGCRSTHDELRDVCHSLRANSAAIVLAVPAAAGVGSAVSAGTVSAPGVAASSGLAATVKTVISGAKFKVGAALASTAIVGVLGLTAGPAINNSSVDNLGLHGQQGVSKNDPTVQRATGSEDSVFDEQGRREQSTKRSGDAWGLPGGDRHDKHASSIGASTSKTVAASDELAPVKENERKPETVGDNNNVALQSAEAAPQEEKDAKKGETTGKPDQGDGPRETVPERKPPADTEEPPSSEPDDGGTSHEYPPQSGYDDVAHDCVDDYYYDQYYNAEEGRTETYEYSYRDGEGYETTVYEYDDGTYYSYTYYWSDSC